MSLLECLEEMIKHDKDDREPFEVILTYNDIKHIVDIEKRHTELVELVNEIRKQDCGGWLKECSSVFRCSEGTEKRQEMARLLDKLYRAAGV
jgi:hypothetical protein